MWILPTASKEITVLLLLKVTIIVDSSALSAVVAHGSHGRLEVCRCLLLDLIGKWMNLEPVEPGNKLVCRSFGSVLRVHHEEHVRKSSPKVGTISMVMPAGLWSVHVHAFGTVELDHGLTRHITQPNGKHGLVFTVNPRAMTKVPSLVLLDHLRDAAVRQDVASMDQAIQHFSCLLDQIRL